MISGNYAFPYPSSSSFSSPLGRAPYPAPMTYAYPTSYPYPYPTENPAAVPFAPRSHLINDPPPMPSANFSSRSTNFELKKNSHLSTGETGPRRNVTHAINDVGDRMNSLPFQPPGSFQHQYPPSSISTSSTLTTSSGSDGGSRYLVSLVGISPHHGILSFPFIASLGQVIESNISPLALLTSSATSSENSSITTSTNTSPSPLSSSDGSTKEPTISYVIVPKTSSQYAQIHALDNAILPVDDCQITVHFPPLTHTDLVTGSSEMPRLGLNLNLLLSCIFSIFCYFSSPSHQLSPLPNQNRFIHWLICGRIRFSFSKLDYIIATFVGIVSCLMT